MANGGRPGKGEIPRARPLERRSDIVREEEGLGEDVRAPRAHGGGLSGGGDEVPDTNTVGSVPVEGADSFR